MALLGKTKQEVVSQFRCSEILEAARRVFAEKGFSDATVDQIAEAAGLAKGTLYLYFPSKREIYLAALRQGVMEIMETSRKNMEAARSIRDKIATFIRTRIEYVEQHHDFFKIYLSEFGNLTHPATVNEDFKNLYQEQLNTLEGMLRNAVKSGLIRKLPADTMASSIFEMTKGIILRRMLGWSANTVDEDVEALSQIIWHGIAKP